MNIEEKALVIAKRVADRCFAERGNRSEVHLHKPTLTAWLQIAVIIALKEETNASA